MSGQSPQTKRYLELADEVRELKRLLQRETQHREKLTNKVRELTVSNQAMKQQIVRLSEINGAIQEHHEVLQVRFEELVKAKQPVFIVAPVQEVPGYDQLG